MEFNAKNLTFLFLMGWIEKFRRILLREKIFENENNFIVSLSSDMLVKAQIQKC
jgi:hypothetical protein